MYCSELRHVETSETPGSSSDPHLWSSNWPLPADSGQFLEIFYANILRKIDFCAQKMFCVKVHKFGETKLICVKKKVNFEANIVFNVQCKTVELGQRKTIHIDILVCSFHLLQSPIFIAGRGFGNCIKCCTAPCYITHSNS